MTPSETLTALARRVAEAHVRHAAPRAILLTGSVARGDADRFSDIDLILYYDELPAEADLAAARQELGAGEFRLLAPPAEEGMVGAFELEHVECQLALTRIASWEEELDRVLVRCELTPANELQKALGGILDGRALHGEGTIAAWQTHVAAYPDALREAMVRHHLTFVPLWFVRERMGMRDALLWRYQVTVEAAFNLVGVLAGLNRLYFSTFQFKGLRKLVAKMTVVPADFVPRLEALFTAPLDEAADELERLVTEVLELVEAQLPGVETGRVRERVGHRHAPWA